VDGGIRRRMYMLPFDMQTTERPDEVNEAAWIFLKDEELTGRLRKEWPGILRWMINGTLLYHKRKFHSVPAVVREATDEFFYAEDHLGRFMNTYYERTNNDSEWIHVGRVYAFYKETMERENQFVESQQQFTKKLTKQKGYDIGPMRGANAFKGLRARRVEQRGEERPELPI
jgi:putative DNA primase/helicase